MTRLKLFSVLFMGMAVVLVSCGQGEKSDRRGHSKGSGGKTYELVSAQIESLYVETSWSQANALYSEVKEGIEFLKSPSQRRNLLAAADNSYCHSMDTIMYLILSGDCKPRHQELREIHKKRQDAAFANVPSTALHSRVEEKFNSHEQMLTKTLPNLKSSGQTPKSIKSVYDAKYEKEAVNKASSYLAENPSCIEIREGLTKVKDGKFFKGWRKAYCNKLVELYLQKTEWQERDENYIIGSLSFYTDAYPNSAEEAEWMSKINEFKFEHQKENN